MQSYTEIDKYLRLSVQAPVIPLMATLISVCTEKFGVSPVEPSAVLGSESRIQAVLEAAGFKSIQASYWEICTKHIAGNHFHAFKIDLSSGNSEIQSAAQRAAIVNRMPLSLRARCLLKGPTLAPKKERHSYSTSQQRYSATQYGGYLRFHTN